MKSLRGAGLSVHEREDEVLLDEQRERATDVDTGIIYSSST